jgi:GT2 family glycosyltransferase
MGKKGEPLVAIVISNYNGEAFRFKNKPMLKTCLQSLKKTRYPNYKVVVADDRSSDKSRQLVAGFKGVDFVLNEPENRFFAKNTNHTIRYVLKKYDPDYIMCLNNDIIVSDGSWLQKLVDTAEHDKRIGAMTMKFIYPNHTMQYAGLELKWGVIPIIRGQGSPVDAYESLDELEILSGMLLITRRAIDRAGLYDENFVMGLEDMDYSLRVKKAGFRIMYEGRASLIHVGGFTTKKATKETDMWFESQQFNYAYFAFKHFGFVDKVKFLFLTGFLRTFFSVGNEGMNLRNLRVRDRIPWRMKVSLVTFFDAYKRYRADGRKTWLKPA